MTQYIIRRCLTTLVLVYVVVTLVFLFIHIIPGDPAALLLSAGGSGAAAPDPESIAALRHQLGLDVPMGTEYVRYLAGLTHFDLGLSLQDRHPVSADIVEALPRTLELILAATILALVAGIPLGIASATRRGTVLDSAITAFVSSGIAIPVFVFGTVLVLIFALYLHLLPAGGFDSFTDDPVAHLKELLLPAVSLAFSLTAIIARMTRSAVLEVLRQDWVRTARAKGLSRRVVMRKHVLRNALSPIVTVVGLQVGTLLGGTVLVEYVFSWPGLSSLLVASASARDYTEVQGIVLVIAVLFILLNLLVDLSYAFLDPRVAYE